ELVGEVWLQQDARVFDDAAEGVERDESAGGEQLFAQSAAYGAPGAGAGFESYALQRFHCGFADAARRRVDNALEGDGVVLVLDELEVAEQVLDFGALVEGEAAHHGVLDAIAAHGFFNQPRLRIGAVEHGGAR